MDFDEILEHIGEFGNYQRVLYLAVCVAAMYSAIHMLANVFVMGTPKHRCFINNCDTSGSHYNEPWLPYTVPAEYDLSKHEVYSQCQMFAVKNNSTSICASGEFTNGTSPCYSWVWDNSDFQSTTVSTWNMVCSDSWKVSFSESSFMAGVLVGSLMFGAISDRFGRRTVFFIAPWMLLIASVGTAFASNWILYTILKFITAVSVNGLYQTGFVLAIELIGPSKRAWCGNIFQIMFAVGELILAGVAYRFRNWHQLQLAISVPTVIIILYPLVIPESVRWQISRHKFEEAKTTISKISRWNKRPVPSYVIDALSDPESYTKEKRVNAGFMQLLRSPVLLKRSLNIFYNWFVNSMVYYGLSMSASNLGGDTYLNFVMLSAVEIPAILLATVVQQWKGRRIVLFAVMVMGGIACILSAFVPSDMQWLSTTFAIIGKSNIAASFSVIYIYSAEIFPTPLRNSGIGVSSMCSRIGGILAPVVADLGAVYEVVPMLVFGISSVLAGLLSLLLPETHNKKLPETVAEAEKFGRRKMSGEDSALLLSDQHEAATVLET